MILAYDYPLLSVFLSVTWFFLWIMWIILLFHVIADIFRSHDLGGVSKTIWLVVVVFLPFLGVFVYVIARGDHMSQHAIEAQKANEAAAQAYIREAAGTPGVADQLAQLASLRDAGTITEAEFQSGKAKLLG